jgi:hypothetical protein
MQSEGSDEKSERQARLSNPWEVGGDLRDCLRHCVDTSFNNDEVFGCATECFIIDRNLPASDWRVTR